MTAPKPGAELERLAARVESAGGADREMDCLIVKAVAGVNAFPSIRGWQYLKGGKAYKVPPYTASLNAAMTLVPEGWGWTIGDKAPDPSISWCEIEGLPWKEGYGWAVERRLIVTATTPALALTAAALRARASQC